MFDIMPFHIDVTFREMIILTLALIIVYLILLIIPGVGSVVKHITHTITKYIVHPLFKYVFEALGLLLLKFIWWFFKYVLFALKVYVHNITRSHETIYPKLNTKKVGVITNEEE